jgi:hypothetical protein
MQTVFTPAVDRLGVSTGAAAMLTFAVSGILHSYVAQITFGKGIVRSFVFFALHGTASSVEYAMRKKNSSTARLSKRAAAFAFAAVTLPLYVGLFVDAMPTWLYKSQPFFPEYVAAFGKTAASTIVSNLQTLGLHEQ